jgi:quercetin dioxygenase-like cupin family protein
MKIDVSANYSSSSLWHDKKEAWHEIFPGVHRRILAHSLTGMMVVYKIDPGSVFPLHSHPHAQFGTFLEGGGEFCVGDSTWKVEAGDSYYIAPGVNHELKTDADKHSVVIDFFTPLREDYKSESEPPDSG